MNTDDNHRRWAGRSDDFSPEYYVQIGPNEVNGTFATVSEHYVAEDASILELGCSSGYHLAHPHDRDYEGITGININDGSFEAMAEYFPGLVDTDTFLTDAIEDPLSGLPDDKFDVIYSVETLQHVHPDDTRVFEEIVRVSSDLVTTVESEGSGPTRGCSGSEVGYVNDDFPLHHRNWKDEFSEFGLAQLFCEPGKRDTVRVFWAP